MLDPKHDDLVFNVEKLSLELFGNTEHEKILLHHVPDAAWLKTVDGRYLAVNAAFSRYTGFNPENIGKSDEQIYTEAMSKEIKEEDNTVITTKESLHIEKALSCDNNAKTYWLEIIKSPVFDKNGQVVAVAGLGRDITEKKNRELIITRQNKLLSSLQKASIKLIERRNVDEVLSDILSSAAEIVHAPFGFIYLLDEVYDVIKFKFLLGNLTPPPKTCLARGEGLAGLVLQTGQSIFIEDYSTWTQRLEDEYWNQMKAAAAVPLIADGLVIGVFAVCFTEQNSRFSEDDISALEQFASLASVALQNTRLITRFKEELEQRIKAEKDSIESEERYKALIQQSSDAIVLSEPDTDRILEANNRFFALSGYSISDLDYLTSQDLAQDENRHLVNHYIDVLKDSTYLPPTVRVLKRKDGKTVRVERTSSLVTYRSKQLIMTVLRDVTERRHNKFLSLLQQTTLDILQHLNKDQLLKEIVIRAAELIEAQAGCCALVIDNELTFKKDYCLNLSDQLFQKLDTACGLSTEVLTTGKPYVVANDANWEKRIPYPEFDQLGAMAGLPLKDVNDAVTGVLCLIHFDKNKRFDEDELYYLQQFAHLASLALNKAYLYEEIAKQLVDLQEAQVTIERAYDDLDRTYDTTLEGWAKALDLRDCETEGHSRRVATLAVHLARAMNVPENQLINYWRGGLLHDIGKLGVPDAILLKPGKLTEEEWRIMQSHSTLGYEWLKPIEYLRPCINIPYYHHERWDGKGYPKGLKEQEIPIEARIFAVVDVWDALNSDRPYRPKWPEKQIREYIKACAGTHFDPLVVDAFLQLPPATFLF